MLYKCISVSNMPNTLLFTDIYMQQPLNGSLLGSPPVKLKGDCQASNLTRCKSKSFVFASFDF